MNKKTAAAVRFGIRLAGVSLAAAVLVACATAPPYIHPSHSEIPPHVQEIIAGRSTLRVDELGYDREDSYRYLQAAFDTDAEVVIIPASPGPWVTSEQLSLPSDKIIVLEPGAQVVAKRGYFHDRGEKLMRGSSIDNLQVYGYGAELRMWKDDFQRFPYEQSQHRHSVALYGAHNTLIEGLTIYGSGGDGIYLGADHGRDRSYNYNVTLRNLYIFDHHRQGISVISADRLLIENVQIDNTTGTLPEAAIDFEPNRAHEQLTRIVVRNLYARFNAGPGILVYLQHLDETSLPVDIRIEDSLLRWNWVGVSVMGMRNNPQGSIELHNVRSGFPNFIWTPSARRMVERSR
ncbi:right-handed parallel beta-helix repeat-containing protein [Spirochaeta africana]|uniref:Right handed beta helix domain-containing protein n=1 Tax=Spirochaeta africana (strain ATCC 700263 / DSM 8902 / Z-7692) TaxID=889378 RepID=H9UF72_SPIAZ|nr:right-handed parallel beta-helix repeat-containing protein [Spirochaeta africana]AFG36165.1 hypothetical protein Spiaf_0056 [Spirochaeta africana DSM 8902]